MKTCHTLIVSAEKRKRKKSGRATANGSERESRDLFSTVANVVS